MHNVTAMKHRLFAPLALAMNLHAVCMVVRADVIPSQTWIGKPEIVAKFYGAMPTGVAVSKNGRIFINYPQWGDPSRFTVAELVNGIEKPFPSVRVNQYKPGDRQSEKLVSVQSVVIDPTGMRLWMVDTGSFQSRPVQYGGPKLMAVDLASNRVIKTILLPADVATKGTYLNDVRFDLKRGKAGTAFITDSSPSGGIIVVDLASGQSWRRLTHHASTMSDPGFFPYVESTLLLLRPKGESPKRFNVGSDGLAISPDGKSLYYRSLTSRHFYAVSTDGLVDRRFTDAEVAASVRDYGEIAGASDGLEADKDGRIYLTDYENNAIHRFNGNVEELETLISDPRALWPDSMSLADDGYLYYTANQLHRRSIFNNGLDKRVKPYVLFRIKVKAKPIRAAD